MKNWKKQHFICSNLTLFIVPFFLFSLFFSFLSLFSFFLSFFLFFLFLFFLGGKCVDAEIAQTVACLMVGARIDYCNSVLYGTSAANLNKLQRVINTLARVVSGTRKRDHITPVLADLHWLPVASRIKFKIALQTFKTLTTNKPEYLADLLNFQTTSRSLRSSSRKCLHIDVARTVLASRVFCHAAPSIWNALPVDLTDFFLLLDSFKKHFKTYLYIISYRC